MKQLIRPTGIISFVLISLLLVLFWWLLADWLLKQSIERSGTALLGAKVELASAQLNLSPFGFELNTLQLTNPDKPMENVVEIAIIEGYLEPLPLLMGQIIVTELRANGVALNTPRSTSGLIDSPKPSQTASPPQEEKAEPSFDFSQALPSLDELLERLPITTIKLADAFDEETRAAFEELEKQFNELPDQQQLKEYEDRLKAAVEGKVKSPQDLKQRLDDLKQLKSELNENKQQLKAVRESIKTQREITSKQWDELKNAPASDLTQLRDSYSLEQDNLGNISGLLFGNQTQKWVTAAQPYLNHGQQLLSDNGEETPPPPPRGEGRFVHFASETARPDFLIKLAQIGLSLSIGELQLTINDITHQPEILNRPTTFTLSGRNLQNIAAIDADGIIDYRDRDNGYAQVKGTITQWQLADFQLSGDSDYPIIISSATQQLEGELRLQQDKLQGNVNSDFEKVLWNQQQQQQASTLQKLLNKIDNFDMQLSLEGQPTAPQVSLRSDLDKRLSNAFKQQFSEERDKLEGKLKTHLNKQIEQRAGKYSDQLKLLNQQQGSTDQQLAKIEEMLKSEVKSGIDEQKDKLENKLKDKLKGLF